MILPTGDSHRVTILPDMLLLARLHAMTVAIAYYFTLQAVTALPNPPSGKAELAYAGLMTHAGPMP